MEPSPSTQGRARWEKDTQGPAEGSSAEVPGTRSAPLELRWLMANTVLWNAVPHHKRLVHLVRISCSPEGICVWRKARNPTSPLRARRPTRRSEGQEDGTGSPSIYLWSHRGITAASRITLPHVSCVLETLGLPPHPCFEVNKHIFKCVCMCVRERKRGREL